MMTAKTCHFGSDKFFLAYEHGFVNVHKMQFRVIWDCNFIKYNDKNCIFKIAKACLVKHVNFFFIKYLFYKIVILI